MSKEYEEETTNEKLVHGYLVSPVLSCEKAYDILFEYLLYLNTGNNNIYEVKHVPVNPLNKCYYFSVRVTRHEQVKLNDQHRPVSPGSTHQLHTGLCQTLRLHRQNTIQNA